MEGFIILSITATITIVLLYFISWLLHYSMCKDERLYGYANFNQFLNEFYKCIGNIENCGNLIYIEKPNDFLKYECYIHAGVIEFDGKYMIIKPYDYWRFLLWKYKLIKKLNETRKIKWE